MASRAFAHAACASGRDGSEGATGETMSTSTFLGLLFGYLVAEGLLARRRGAASGPLGSAWAWRAAFVGITAAGWYFRFPTVLPHP